MPEVPEVPWGHRVGLMSLLMIHKACMPVYSDPDFSCGRTGRDGPTEGSTRGPRGPKNKIGFYNSALKGKKRGDKLQNFRPLKVFHNSNFVN